MKKDLYKETDWDVTDPEYCDEFDTYFATISSNDEDEIFNRISRIFDIDERDVRVIYNDPYTILYIDDVVKIVSKASAEPFDKEKGLLMCLAKAYGLTNCNLKRIIKNSIDMKEKKDIK